MNLSNATIATRLLSWHSFFTTEVFLNSTESLPFDDEIDAILGAEPAWVTVDPVEPETRAEFDADSWDFDTLLSEARNSGDPKIQYLADRCADWERHYMDAMDNAQTAH